jgi:large subunit ribosomal protein L23
MNPREVILKYSLTEKASSQSMLNKYTFVVSPKVNRTQVKNAIEQHFDNVEVDKVNILNRKGKSKSSRMRGMRTGGRTSSTKRAIVTLSKGSIDLV